MAHQEMALADSANTGCVICGAKEYLQLYHESEAGPEENYDLVQCSACDFVYVSGAREPVYADRPVEDYLESWGGLEPLMLTFQYQTLITAMRQLGSEFIPKPGFTRRLLDVGCGGGYFLAHARAHGWDVTGIEPWGGLGAWARNFLKLDVHLQPLEDVELEPASFHALTAHLVIPLVRDPVAFLARCFELLHPGGVVLLTTPNFDSTERQEQGWNWRHIVSRTHVSYFRLQTLQAAAEKAGFSNIEIQVTGGQHEDSQLILQARRSLPPPLTWEDLSEDVDDDLLPILDRRDIEVSKLSPEQRHWRENGYLILKDFIPQDLVDAYCFVRERLPDPLGWLSTSPYMFVKEIRDLCLYKPLTDMLEHLIGSPMGMHLTLTGWVSTNRAWHQDDYLNPAHVRGHYCPVWFALDKIDPDCGPFEYVPGSHQMPLVRQDKVLELLPPNERQDAYWPWRTERLLAPFFQHQIETNRLQVDQFLGNKGDVLIWHSRLLHRGSLAKRPGMTRKAVISHYSAIDRRSDLGEVTRHGSGGHYFLTAGQKADLGDRKQQRRLWKKP